MDPAALQVIVQLINSAKINGISEIEFQGLKVRFRHTSDGTQTVDLPKPKAFTWETDLTPQGIK